MNDGNSQSVWTLIPSSLHLNLHEPGSPRWSASQTLGIPIIHLLTGIWASTSGRSSPAITTTLSPALGSIGACGSASWCRCCCCLNGVSACSRLWARRTSKVGLKQRKIFVIRSSGGRLHVVHVVAPPVVC